MCQGTSEDGSALVHHRVFAWPPGQPLYSGCPPNRQQIGSVCCSHRGHPSDMATLAIVRDHEMSL
jgi:hypothetical protein